MAPVKASRIPVTQGDGDLAAAQRVLSYASEALTALSAALDGQFVRAINSILAAPGRVIVSGMGKSGHIARKIAATLSSTGTPAYFVHPAEASHGDLGAITGDDVLLMLSWGGETAELTDLITYAKRFRIPLIGIASNPDSTLMQAADVKLLLPRAPEACPMGLAPTTSTTMMLSLGDALAVALMERKGFSSDQYRDFHPGGSLGRTLIRVGDLMHAGDEVPLAGEGASMREVLIVMTARHFGCVGIVDGRGRLTGIITDGDLSRHLDSENFLDRKAAQVMTKTSKIAHPGQLAVEALALMNEKKITRLFVLEAGDAAQKPVGILHIHDCLRAGLDLSPEDATARHDWSARARSTALEALRYTRFVGVMKRALPAAAFAVIAAVVAFFFVQRQPARMAMTYRNMGHIENDLAMTKPRLTGSDSKGNPFVVTAEAAIQDAKNPKRARLKKIEADLTTGKNGWINADAAGGEVDMQAGTLELDGGIDIFSDNGYELHTAAASLDLNKWIVHGHNPVTGQGPMGSMRADEFHFDRTNEQLLLSGHVRMTLDGRKS